MDIQIECFVGQTKADLCMFVNENLNKVVMRLQPVPEGEYEVRIRYESEERTLLS